MPKILKFLFVISVIMFLSALAAQYYFTEFSKVPSKNGAGSPQEIMENNNSIGGSQSTNLRFSLPTYREMQARYIKTEGQAFYFQEIQEGGALLPTESVRINNPVLYVCRTPVQGKVYLDPQNPGHIELLNAGDIKEVLSPQEQILVVTIKFGDNEEELNYFVSAKCSET